MAPRLASILHRRRPTHPINFHHVSCRKSTGVPGNIAYIRVCRCVCHNFVVTSHKSQLSDMPMPMPRSEIPVDVLRDILDHVDQEGLAIMCRVNKICCSCSQDVLYRDLYVKTRRASKVQQTLAQSTHLARKVRSFDTLFNTDLAMALRNMTSLRNLKLPTGIFAYILDGCTFKLDSFGCDGVHNRNESFQNFLSSQPSLKYVTFSMNLDPTLSLEATCLLNITRIKATFPWLPYLIPGRPLSEVISDEWIEYEHSTDLSFFALSTTPIQKLTIDYSYLYPTPVHLLASFLPSLTHFTLTVWKNYTFFRNEGVCGLPIY
jgi:hypothetical protein